MAAASFLHFFLNHLELTIVAVMGLFSWWKIHQKKVRQKNAKKALKKSVESSAGEPTTLHPEIDPAVCAGCGACLRVCPEGDILQMINHKAVLVSPAKCVGHGECEKSCPVGAITLVFGTKTRGVDIPRLTTDYETNVPGLYIAGELGGMGLIRNAVKQGVAAGDHAVKNLRSGQSNDVDLLIVGAGPAGMSVALTAIAANKTYKVIEQNTFGGTVYNFPRQKIVMSHPAQLPIIGEMKFNKNKISKEQLLDYWEGVRKKTGMKVQEKTRFQGLEVIPSGFKIKTDKGEYTASKVILAMGVRGSPRRLGLTNEDLPKVTYNLLEPDQYREKEIVVVGGGNAGVEAAQMLAKGALKNRVRLLVRGAGFDRCNEENKNKTLKLEKEKLLEIWYNSSVTKIEPAFLHIKKGDQELKVDNDFLFIFAGAESPHAFLMSLGVKIDKKFGEALKKQSG